MQNIELETQHNIDHEKRLIELLGYHLIGPDNSNCWLIVDEENHQVGFIQYEKLFNKNKKKGYPATFGYRTVIDSSTVSYKSLRKINNVDCKQSVDLKFHYMFDIKRENGDTDTVEISMDECPRLNVWSKKYGFSDFKVDSKGLFLDFKSKTEKFNVEELIIFRSNGENVFTSKTEYVYQIRYCDKEMELSDDNQKGTTIREISGIYNQHYQQSNQLKLSEKTWVNGNLRTNKECEVQGTVEEMAMKHQMGIDSFHYFRTFINQVLPFQQDVVSAMLNEEIIRKQGLSIFISDSDNPTNQIEADKQFVKQ